MSQQCKNCKSFAINPHLHGREPAKDLDLCDVCYWRTRSKTKEDQAIINATVELYNDAVWALEEDYNLDGDVGRSLKKVVNAIEAHPHWKDLV